MRPSTSTPRRSSSRQVDARGSSQIDRGTLLTALLLAGIIFTGPLVLGAARLWIELPLLGLAAVLLALQGLRLRAIPPIGAFRQADAIDLTVVLFVLYAFARWLTSPTEYFSRIEALDIFAYAAVFLTCRHGLAPRAIGVWLLFGLVALGVFETCFGYYLHNHPEWFPFGESERLQLWYAPRWVGTYGCPNHYASLLVMATGAALALGCFSKLSWPARIVLIYLAGVIMIGVMFSGSRGAWIASVASIGALMIFGLRHGTVRWWIPVAGTVLVLAAAVALFALSKDVRDRVTLMTTTMEGGQVSNYVRLILARDALTIASDHPLFGTGPGTFVFVHPRYQGPNFDRKAVLTHDDYLNCLDDYGLVGLALALFFIIAVTIKFFQPLRADNRWQERVVIAAGFAAWAALLAHSFLDFNMHIPANALLLFALTGLALGRLNRDEAFGHWSTLYLSPMGRWLSVGVVAIAVLDLAALTPTAVADILYENSYAQAKETAAPEAILTLHQSLQFDPDNAQALMLLGDLHRYRASREEKIEDQIAEGQKALDAYRRALKANTIDDTLYARMGMTFDVMHRYSEAYFCYDKAVKAQPYNGQFWYQLGNHFWQRGLWDQAAEAFEQSLASPYGREGSAEALQELKKLAVSADASQPGIPAPAPGSNDLVPESAGIPQEPAGLPQASAPEQAVEQTAGTPSPEAAADNPESHPATVP